MVQRYERFSGAIFGINRCIQKIEADEMKKYGLKGAYARYLVITNGHPEGLTATELCKICDKDKAAVSRAVTEMEKRGLLWRKNAAGTAYRAMLLLTEEGKAIACRVCQNAEIAVELAGRGLDEESRKGFYAALDLIAKNLQNVCKKGIIETEQK